MTVYALARAFAIDTQPAIVAAIVAMSLARKEPSRHAVHPLLLPIVVAAVAPLSAGVGWLLRAEPLVGAVAFVAGMFVSVWLRNFGPRARAAGALIALPLVAILAVPPPRTLGAHGALGYLAIVECASLIAFAYATLVRRVFAPLFPRADAIVVPDIERAAGKGPSAQTKMAIQMAVALTAAFAMGYVIFPMHWGWVVLTAFIVCSGALGRSDAAYKGILRLVGAIGGTIAAAVVVRIAVPTGPPEAIAIFAMLYLGLWLRDVNYAYWACCITLVLSLLGNVSGGGGSVSTIGVLAVRLQAILVGAICAVAATWFVFPIETTSIVRLRLAGALRALDDLIVEGHDGAEREVRLATFEHRMHELRTVAPPMRLHRRILARAKHENHPATWVDLAHDVRERALASSAAIVGARRSAVRRAIGESRKAIASHGKTEADDARTIAAALGDLRERIPDRGVESES